MRETKRNFRLSNLKCKLIKIETRMAGQGDILNCLLVIMSIIGVKCVNEAREPEREEEDGNL